MNKIWLIAVVAYFLGSIPFGFLIVKVRGRDIRESGSGNIGAANVARSAGAIAGALTLILDAGKGYLAVWIAAHWTHSDVRWMMVAALAAVIGHMFPVWLRFKGGKGVATSLGVFLPIA
ncbi:MAG TPA: glycerol-3-phosphate acyltransferase, partial [Candidatus Acidoferrales bacterium]|nr:glycerol-3-phosphate acyltransferase [Candidatus Acidoferrales bacterium]